MNKDNYINSIDHLQISSNFNERTEKLMKDSLNYKSKKISFNTKKLVFSFASLAIILTTALLTFKLNPLQNGNMPESSNQIVATDKEENNTMMDETQETVITIPTIVLPKKQAVSAEMDMIGLFVYKGRVYTQSNSSFELNEQSEMNKKEVLELKGTYLGKTVGGIDEWSKQDDYSKEFASTIGVASVYTVKGYDSKYRLMVYYEFENEFDAQIYDSFGGLELRTGADYFSKLKLKNKVASVTWESYDSWNNGKSRRILGKNDSVLQTFVNALYTSTPLGEMTDMFTENAEYDSQKFIYLKTKNNLVTALRLFKGGYVYAPMAGFFQIDPKAFNALWNKMPVKEPATNNEQSTYDPSCGVVSVELLLTPASYPVGTKELLLTIKNNSSEELWYGVDYQIEQQVGDGWVVVPASANLAFIEIAQLLAPNSEQEFKVDLSLLEPKLEAGNYRVVKTINNLVCYANFTLTR